jgi:antitoxin YefM
MDHVYEDHETLIVTRKNSENIVLLSLDDYNSLIETQYLLSTKANTAHLLQSLEQLEEGHVSIHNFQDLNKMNK